MMDSQVELPRKWIYHSHVTWDIHNFFLRPQDMSNTIESPVFQTNFDVPVKWRLTLRLREKYVENYVTEICLGRARSCPHPSCPYVIAHLKLTDNSGDSHNIIGNFDYTHHVGQNFLFPLIDDNITSYSGKNSTVSYKIECDMFINNMHSKYWSDKNKDLNSLSSDLLRFYFAGNLTDLILKVDNERFHVHRAIVELRSPCLVRLLAEKSDDPEIDLSKECSVDELKEMVRYWYSGNLCGWPRGQPSRVSTFLQKMGQDELIPYCGSENTSLSTILVTWVIVDDNDFRECGMMKIPEADYGSDEQSWKLYFYPRGIKNEDDSIGLNVEGRGQIPSTHPAYIRIFFKGGDGNEYAKKTMDSGVKSYGKFYFSHCMSHSDFNKRRKDILSDNALVIRCIIEYGPETNPRNEQAIKHPYEILADKLKDLWKIRKLGDVTLETEDGKKLQAHSAILAARSRYFELDLTKSESVACKNRVIKLTDIKKKDLELILKYMYYAEIDLNLELAQNLYPFVCKYEIKVLKDLCSEYL